MKASKIRFNKSDYFVGGSYEADYDAGYEIVTSLIDSGCKNIAANWL